MTLACIAIIAGALLADEAKVDSSPASIFVTIVRATHEGGAKTFGPGLDKAREALEDLSFDHYSLIKESSFSIPLGQKQSVELDDYCSLIISPLKREQNGQVRIQTSVRVPGKDESPPELSAVSTTVSIGPGKQFKLRGLKLDQGEMVVVITLKK
jgi:hypothetical protein